MKMRNVSLVLPFLGLFFVTGCDDGSEERTDQCAPPASKCEDGVQKTCVGSIWQETACPDGCDEKGEKCLISGQAQCVTDVCDTANAGILKKCVDNKYVPEKCPDDRPVCSGMACVADTCTPNQSRCSGDMSAFLTCNDDGAWNAPVPCPQGQKCDAREKKCVDESDAAECENDDIKCVEQGKNTYFICAGGKWSETAQSCPDAGVCTGSGAQAKCTAPVAPTECTPGQSLCEGNRIKICYDDGTWDAPVDCPQPGDICNTASNLCEPPPAPCAGEADRCSEDGVRLEKCADGFWNARACAEDQTCLVLEASKKAACADCVPGSIRCEGANLLQTCTDLGQWETIQDCAVDNKVCDPTRNKCYTCLSSNVECGKDGSIWSCSNMSEYGKRYLKYEAQCDKKFSCLRGQANSRNSPAACMCQNKEKLRSCSSDGLAILQCNLHSFQRLTETVSDYIWFYVSDPIESCPHGCVDPEDKFTMPYCKCADGTFKCDGRVMYYCRNGEWSVHQMCKKSQTCNPDTGTCNALCKPSGTAAVCSGNALWACKEQDPSADNATGTYERIRQCPQYCAMDAGAAKCVATVAPGATRCASDLKSVETRNGDQWKTQKTCKSDEVCMHALNSDARTPQCKPKICTELEMRCDGDEILQKCFNNAWETVGTCGEDARCDAKLGRCAVVE